MPPNIGMDQFNPIENRPDIRIEPPRDNLELSPSIEAKKDKKRYRYLHLIIVPVAQWGVPDWDELTVSQRLSIEMTLYLLNGAPRSPTDKDSSEIQARTGVSSWDIICASVPGLPLVRDEDFENTDVSQQTLSGGRTAPRTRSAHRGRFSRTDSEPPIEYWWIRDRLITFCRRLSKRKHVIHAVKRMVQKLRPDGHSESVGIILSSQEELVVVAVDGFQVRCTPTLDIRATNNGKGPRHVGEGLLLLTQLLSPPLTVPPLPWRIPGPRQPASIPKLPLEALRAIIQNTDLETYLSLCRVSRFFHSACVANPRIGNYTVLRKILGFRSRVPMVFTAWCPEDGEVKAISLRWHVVRYMTPREEYQWGVEEVSSRELDTLIILRNVGLDSGYVP